MAEVGQLFRYRAVEPESGRVQRGEMTGADAYAVRAALRRSGWQVERIDAVGRGAPRSGADGAGSWWVRWRQERRCRNRRALRADLYDAIAALVAAGMPLEQALGSLAASPARRGDERRMLRQVREAVRGGQPLSGACRRHPDWFDPLDVAMLAAGQAAGELPRVLRDLAAHHQRGTAAGHRLGMALAYPALLTVAAVAVTIFISQETLPQLLTMLRGAELPEPALSRAVVAVGQTLLWWWPAVVVGLTALVVGLRRAARSVDPERPLGRLLHGNVVARARSRTRVAQVASILARLLKSGVPLDEALAVAEATVSDGALRALLARSAEAVRRGEDLSAVIERSPLLDPEFAQLLRVAEQAGDLPEMLERIAERSEQAAARSIDRVAAVLEPLAIIVLMVLIGLIVFAAVLPLVRLGDML